MTFDQTMTKHFEDLLYNSQIAPKFFIFLGSDEISLQIHADPFDLYCLARDKQTARCQHKPDLLPGSTVVEAPATFTVLLHCLM